jgi:hypothetical protein
MAIDAPISMSDFEDAIHTWFVNATGLETIWVNQSAPRPDYPYASLNITAGPIPVSPIWELRDSTNLSRPAGTEVEFIGCVPCTFSISCQTYVNLENANNPNYNSRDYIIRAHGALSLPSPLALLQAAQISVVDRGTVTNLDEVINAAYVSRANLDVTFGASLNAIEYAGYISQVQIKSTAFGIDTIIST